MIIILFVDDDAKSLTVLIVFEQAGHLPTLFAKMLLTEQVPPLFLLEFAHLRKQGISSPRFAKNINHPLHCGFGQSKSKSGPTSLANLPELGLAVMMFYCK
jgi:hypothetical protein